MYAATAYIYGFVFYIDNKTLYIRSLSPTPLYRRTRKFNKGARAKGGA